MIANSIGRTALLAVGLAGAAGLAGQREPMLPTSAPPIVYYISYSRSYFTEPDYIEQFRAAPPGLLHVGKAVPISHLWGPIRLYHGENQYTGGPGHTLSWENIALLSPQALEKRIETIRQTLRRYHAIGIREIVPYISYHTLAGDHQKRLGFWRFYDNWNTYARRAGPRPSHDPFDWLAVDARGKFLPGSCGGYSPAYYAPLHRYRACINHPDWAEWHRRLIRMVAEVGYDGCFVDNAHPDPCYCRYCKALFREFLDRSRNVAWVQRLTQGLDFEKLALDSPDAPPELVRRWRVLRTGDHLGMLRKVGRKVKPGFTIFPNSGRIDECLQVGGKCDRLMFESTFSPGIDAAEALTDGEDVVVRLSPFIPAHGPPITYRYELHDAASWMEMVAEITTPGRVGALRPYTFTVKVISVGASLQDGDAAEDFHLVLRGVKTGKRVRLDLEPRGAIGGTGSSRKPRQPPARLTATWHLSDEHLLSEGAYTVWFGFRYTDDSHKETTLRPRLDKLTWGKLCLSHQAELFLTQHMRAKPIYLGYEARRKGWENVQELSLAEMAAFSGGGGFSGRGAPQAKYRAFFQKHPELFDGWEPTAPAAVLYAYWGPNPLNTYKPHPAPTIADYLGKSHRLFVALVDKKLPEKAEALAGLRVIYLQSRAYEMSEAQLAALRDHARTKGLVALENDGITINGEPAARALAPGRKQQIPDFGVVVWDWRHAPLIERTLLDKTEKALLWLSEARQAPTRPVAPRDGLRRNLRFALYRKGGRLALHVVNTNVCLLDTKKKVLEVEPTPLQVPLPEGWTAAKATCYDPDARPQTVDCTVDALGASLTLPKTHIYKIVLLEKE